MSLAFDKSARRVDLDGRLHVADCRISKANVCEYLGREIPARGLDPNRIYRMYRDRAALKAAVASFENLPLLSDHKLTSANAPQKSLTVGTVSNVRYQHPYLVADLAVWDAEAIRRVQTGEQRELSCGYRHTADMTPGTVDGERYDGVMREIVGNHVALVETGRAGPDVMVGDAQRPRTTVEAFPNFDRLTRVTFSTRNL